MNGLILFEKEKTGKMTYRVSSGPRLQHLKEQLHVHVGQELSVTVLNQACGRARVLRLEKESLDLEICQLHEVSAPILTMIVGLSRPPTLKKILEHGTTMGVGHFIFTETELTEKSYRQSKVLEESKAREIMLLGLSQARTLAHLPKLTILQGLHQLSQLPAQRYFFSLSAQKTLLHHQPDPKLATAFAIGPERGWTYDEERQLLEMGFHSTLLSRSVLRVEHAVFSALAHWELLQF